MNAMALAFLPLLFPAPSIRPTSSDITALVQKLKSPDAIDRRQAVLDLAKDGTPAAWPHVIEALRDGDAMVADEAEIQLGNVADASIVKSLLAKDGLSSSDPWVRLRSAEALGRIKAEIDAAALCRHMSDKDPELRRIVAWSIERLARGDHLESKSRRFAKQELENVSKKDSDPNVRAAALCARHALEPFTFSNLFELMSGKESGVVHSAVTHLVGSVDAEQLSVIGSMTSGEDVCVQQAYVRELARAGTRSAMHSLVLRLSAEINLRLSWTIVEMLQSLSGETFKTDPVKWLEWQTKLPTDWKPKGSPFAKDAKHEYDTGGAAFLDLPLLSDRIVLLFDFSESLWTKLGGGKTRKELIEVELRHFLEHLPKGVEFNLIPYADAPQPWEKGLVGANAGNVKKALAFFKDCKANGKSNFWDAALLAFADPRVDTILLVSNGEPSGGRHWNLELIRTLFAERNRFRHVVFDALILGSKPEVQELWAQTCLQNGGRMRTVEMK
jgi:HEAT repeat protein